MSNCSRICVTAAEYNPAIHTIIGAYATEEECLAACNCVDPSTDWGGVANWNSDLAWSIAYGANKFVMVSPLGGPNSLTPGENYKNLKYSTDGKNWTTSEIQLNTNIGIGALAFGNNVFVGYSAADGNTPAQIHRSVDGINWTAANSSFDNLDVLKFFDNKFFGFWFNEVYTSPDGVTWTTTNIGPGLTGTTWKDAVYTGTQVVAIGGDAGDQNIFIAKSSDAGLNWTIIETDNTNINFILQSYNFAYGAGKFVATYLESNGSFYNNWFATSTDAITWTKTTRPAELSGQEGKDSIIGLAYGNNKFYAFCIPNAGAAHQSDITVRAVSSVDGLNWIVNTVSNDVSPFGAPSESAVAPNGQIVAADNPPWLNPPANV